MREPFAHTTTGRQQDLALYHTGRKARDFGKMDDGLDGCISSRPLHRGNRQNLRPRLGLLNFPPAENITAQRIPKGLFVACDIL